MKLSYNEEKIEGAGKSGKELILYQYGIDTVSILSILTNTIRYCYSIAALGISAEPDLTYSYCTNLATSPLQSSKLA
jgi:hypothetical protein